MTISNSPDWGDNRGSMISWMDEQQTILKRVLAESNYILFAHDFTNILRGVFGLGAEGENDCLGTYPLLGGGHIHNISTNAESTRLFDFLHPEDMFVQTLLQVATKDKRTTYQFPIYRLPMPIQRMLERSDFKNIPGLFASKLVFDSGNTAMYLELNALDFFFYTFAFCAVNSHKSITPGLCGTLYEDLVVAYLEFFIPFQTRELKYETVELVPGVSTISYNCDPVMAGHLLDILQEFWLKQNSAFRPQFGNSYGRPTGPLTIHGGTKQSNEPVCMPCEALVNCCRWMVVHLHKLAVPLTEEQWQEIDFRRQDYAIAPTPDFLAPSASPYNLRVRSTVPTIPRIPNFESEKYLQAISNPLYGFLDLCLNNWPQDSTIRAVFRLYYAFSQPWNYMYSLYWADMTDFTDGNYPADYLPRTIAYIEDPWTKEYVEKYYSFYSVLMKNALCRIVKILQFDRYPIKDHYALGLLYSLLLPFVPHTALNDPTKQICETFKPDDCVLLFQLKNFESQHFSMLDSTPSNTTLAPASATPHPHTPSMYNINSRCGSHTQTDTSGRGKGVSGQWGLSMSGSSRPRPFYTSSNKLGMIQDLRLEIHRREVLFTSAAQLALTKRKVGADRGSRYRSSSDDDDLLTCIWSWCTWLWWGIALPVMYLCEQSFFVVYWAWTACGGVPPASWLPYAIAYTGETPTSRRVSKLEHTSPAQARHLHSPSNESVLDKTKNMVKMVSEWNTSSRVRAFVPQSAYTKAKSVLDAFVVAMGQDFPIDVPSDAVILSSVAVAFGPKDQSRKFRLRQSGKAGIAREKILHVRENIRPTEVRFVVRSLYVACEWAGLIINKPTVDIFAKVRCLSNRWFLCISSFLLMWWFWFGYISVLMFTVLIVFLKSI
eukprot:CFRG4307T1